MTAKIESIMEDILARLNTQLASDFSEDNIATTNIQEDIQKIVSSQTPRLYLFRESCKQEAPEENIASVMSTKITIVIYVRQEKETETGTIQALLNEAEESVFQALLSNANGEAITTTTSENIPYTIIYEGTESPVYGMSEAFMDMNFEIFYRR